MGQRPPLVTLVFPKALPHPWPSSLRLVISRPEFSDYFSFFAASCPPIPTTPSFMPPPPRYSWPPTLLGLTNDRTWTQVLGGVWLWRKD